MINNLAIDLALFAYLLGGIISLIWLAILIEITKRLDPPPISPMDPMTQVVVLVVLALMWPATVVSAVILTTVLIAHEKIDDDDE